MAARTSSCVREATQSPMTFKQVQDQDRYAGPHGKEYNNDGNNAVRLMVS